MIKVSDYVIQFLENLGIKNVFFLSGGMIMHLIDSLRKSNLNAIPVLHEQSAGIMAEAESIYKTELSVVIVTAGPGILNIITAVSSAYIDGNPLLIIAGQCKTNDSMKSTGLRQKGIQEVDALSILKPITKYAVSITKPEKIKYELKKAVKIALTRRHGPVFIEIPLDIQGKIIDEDTLYNYHIPNISITEIYEEIYSSIKIINLIKLINNSKKPVILAGNGIRQAGVLNQFKILISKLKIPVLLTWKSIDFLDENNELYSGRPGSIASRYSNLILQECDLLINISSRLDLPTVAYDYKNFAKNAIRIMIDIDKKEIYKTGFNLYFHTDIRCFLLLLEKKINKIKIDTTHWLKYCKELKEKYPIYLPEYKKSDKINPYYFIEILSQCLNPKDIIVPSSSGSASEMVCQSFKIKEGQRIICSNGLGSMGFALPHAIGVAISSKKRIICIEGDGSFQHNIQEMELLSRYNLNIKLFIFNNNGYSSIRNTHCKFFNDEYLGCDDKTGLTFPDIEKISTAYNIPTYKIENQNNLKEDIIKVLNTEGPIICEIIIDETIQTAPKVLAKTNAEGKIVSGQLEDMWPFLEK